MNYDVIQPRRKRKQTRGLRVLLWFSAVLYLAGLITTTIILSTRNRTMEAQAAQPVPPEPAIEENKVATVVAEKNSADPASGTSPAAWKLDQLPQVGLPPEPESAAAPLDTAAVDAPKTAQIVGWDYKKCWDSQGRERHKDSCVRLGPMEQKISQTLGAMVACKNQFSGIGLAGVLNLMIEVDIPQNLTSVWNAGDSSLRFANPTIACIASSIRTTHVSDLVAEFDRYQVLAQVSFTGPIRSAAASALANNEMIEAFESTGVAARVINDKVRVRKTPVEGEIIGLISAGNNVLIIDERADENGQQWCRILTPNKNVGWMVCWALERGGSNLAPVSDTDS